MIIKNHFFKLFLIYDIRKILYHCDNHTNNTYYN